MGSVEEDFKKFILSDSDDSDEYAEEDRYSAVEESNRAIKSTSGSYHSNQQVAKESAFQPTSGLQHKYMHKISVDKYEKAQDLLSKKTDAGRIRLKDKGDRATVEQVLDPRTRMILFKMLHKQIFSEVQGCISTGKEANVYFAPVEDGPARAVKIYKTSILTFKDRDRYVSGDYRFRHGYSHKNPRKMVQTWAEKEFRNLLRIHKAGLPSPEPIILRSHVLVMEFIGKNGVPAPLLKNTELSIEKYSKLYLDMASMMKNLYCNCKLIHADLSEYNLLYHDGKALLIDVSQSVEPDHPHAMDFLRMDCKNITHFFKKKGVAVMSVRQLFEFITNPNIVSDDVSKYMEGLEKTPEDDQEFSEEAKVDEEVFKQAYIPKRLDEVIDAERDIFVGNDEALYHTVTGLQPQNTEETVDPESNKTNSDESSDEDSDADDQENKSKGFVNSRRPRDESPNTKKERKKALKEARREKQKTKIPKHVKKRKEKLAHQNSKK
ncbi:serine/threonine-protein kinase RIO1-like [Argiope bruennichi]|uniref:Serine/threonine-protein kinase RIO1 n=1 Tax=Argiope bruennichi TaxID=94029 RepID=A0A8T0F9D3_ARGBR|nr:serine/threonine-protein kinase RIO1-like [Argiope bruennichi]XP_055942673.1 serine/threonine-protein kinase RIO1-like [Argiope bruennichi]KAF8786982.1 Serine/threonine-protein kinase RIO1 like protein [Argiope bruennichi]